MVQKYIIDKVDIPRLLNGEEIPLEQGNKARAFCVEIAGGMTNGEVMKAIFPDIEVTINEFLGSVIIDGAFGKFITTLDWWLDSYKGVSE